MTLERLWPIPVIGKMLFFVCEIRVNGQVLYHGHCLVLICWTCAMFIPDPLCVLGSLNADNVRKQGMVWAGLGKQSREFVNDLCKSLSGEPLAWMTMRTLYRPNVCFLCDHCYYVSSLQIQCFCRLCWNCLMSPSWRCAKPCTPRRLPHPHKLSHTSSMLFISSPHLCQSTLTKTVYCSCLVLHFIHTLTLLPLFYRGNFLKGNLTYDGPPDKMPACLKRWLEKERNPPPTPSPE